MLPMAIQRTEIARKCCRWQYSEMASGDRFADGNCQEMAIPTLFLSPATGDLPDRRRVSD